MSLIVRAIIFDAFETLVHNESHRWAPTFQEICRSQRLPVGAEALWGRWRLHEGQFREERVRLDDLQHTPPFRSYWQAWRDCFQLAFTDLGLTGDPASSANAMVRALGQRPPYADAVQALERLRKGPWTLAVLSNADDASLGPVLEDNGFTAFQVVLSSERLRAYKPHPTTYQQTIKALGCLPQEAVYVGDQPLEDVHGAKLQGLKAVLLNRSGVPKDRLPTPPDYEIRSLPELLEILEYPRKGR